MARPSPPAPTAPSQSKPTAEPLGQPIPAPASPFAIDDRGFLNSIARCDGTQTAVAIGRTPGALVVICAGEDGQYDYLGVRLSDDAVLEAASQSTPAHAFVAQNASVTYAVSAAELLVTSGETVIKKEPMIEFLAKG